MATLFVLIGVVGGLILAVAVNLVASDLFDWGRRWAEMLVRHAATRWPPTLRERLLEEWLAELDHTPGMIWRMRFAISIAVSRPPHDVGSRELQKIRSRPVLSALTVAIGVASCVVLTTVPLVSWMATIAAIPKWFPLIPTSLSMLLELIFFRRRDGREWMQSFCHRVDSFSVGSE